MQFVPRRNPPHPPHAVPHDAEHQGEEIIMSTKINDGGPAFPTQHMANASTVNGMTLRDWFAGQALAGMLVNGFMPTQAFQNFSDSQGVPYDYTKGAYDIADAMLAARAANQERAT